MEPWSWSPVLKVLTGAAIAVGYVLLIFTLCGVWKAI